MRCEWGRRGEGGERGGRERGGTEASVVALWGCRAQERRREIEAAWDVGGAGRGRGVVGFKVVGTLLICTGLGV